MDGVPPRVLERLRALRALAADTSTTGPERELAAQRADRLAARYGLTADDVAAPDPPAPAPPPQAPWMFRPGAVFITVYSTGTNTTWHGGGYSTVYWR